MGRLHEGYAPIHELLCSHGMTLDSSIWKTAPKAVSAGTENARIQYYRLYDTSLFFKASENNIVDRNGRMLNKEARRETQTQKSGFLRYCRRNVDISMRAKRKSKEEQ